MSLWPTTTFKKATWSGHPATVFLAVALAVTLLVSGCGGSDDSDDNGGSTDSSSETIQEDATEPDSTSSDDTTSTGAGFQPGSVPDDESPDEMEERIGTDARAIMTGVNLQSSRIVDVVGDYQLLVETEVAFIPAPPCVSTSSPLATNGHRYETPVQSFDTVVQWPRDGAMAHLEKVAAAEVGCVDNLDGELIEFAEVSLDGAAGYRWLTAKPPLSPTWFTQVERNGWIISGNTVESAELADQLVLVVLDSMGG